MDLEKNYDTALSSSNVGVRIERAIIKDGKPLGKESETTAERDLYPPQISVRVWDETLIFATP
jgi:hypothetical protein